MRTRIWPYMTALAALAALSIADRSAGAPPRDKTVRYVVIRLDTLGGSAGGGSVSKFCRSRRQTRMAIHELGMEVTRHGRSIMRRSGDAAWTT